MGRAVDVYLSLLAVLLVFDLHAARIECYRTSSASDDITNLVDGNYTIHSQYALGTANRTDLTGCCKFSGSSEEQLGRGVLQVYMLRNAYARAILPQLSFIAPTWSRMDAGVFVRNVSWCGSVVGNRGTSPFKFPYPGKVDDFDILTLEYNVTDGHRVERRRFQFFLPFFPRKNLSDIEEWEVFIYVDVTDSRQAIVFWEPAPPSLNISKYQLNVTCRGAVDEILEYENVFSFHLPYDWTTPEMACQFHIRPRLPSSKWGRRSSSPPVIVTRREVLNFWIMGICSMFVTLSFLTYRLYETKHLKFKHRVTGSSLLIYEAKTELQLELVCLLTQFLEQDHHLKIHLDHRDIPLTETKDPLKWFVEIIPKCEYFIFLQLPVPKKTCVPPGVYSSQKMATDNIFRIFNNSSRLLNVELELCPCEEIWNSWISSKLKSRYKYILPNDMCNLVGQKNPFESPLGTRIKQAIADCVQESKSPIENKVLIVESDKEAAAENLRQDEEKNSEDEENTEIVVSGRRCLLESFNLDGKKNDSDSD